VQQLHERLIQGIGRTRWLGPTWKQLFAEETGRRSRGRTGGSSRRSARRTARHRRPRSARLSSTTWATVDEAVRRGAAREIGEALGVRDEGNWPSAILQRLYAAGLTLELRIAGRTGAWPSRACGASIPGGVAVQPNFAPRRGYEIWVCQGVRVTLDNLYPLKAWPEIFSRARRFFLRNRSGVRAATTATSAPAAFIQIRRALERKADELAA